MALWMPGATHKHLPANKNHSCKHRTRKDGIVLHTAASDAGGLGHYTYWARDSVGVSCHFYVDRDGTVWQFMPLEETSWTSVQGCWRTIGIETQGWPGEAWTDAQVNSLARIVAWAASVEGWPIRAMASTSMAERGVGYHSLKYGGEVWNPNDHDCPGNTRVSQIPLILSLARSGETTTTTAPQGQEEEEEMKTTGLTWKNAAGKTMCALVTPGSGFFSAWTTESGGTYNNPIAKGFDTGSFVPVTESHARALAASCALVRGDKQAVDVTLTAGIGE